jgi:TRAP transporter 4TM/12TM fusion protein
MLQAPTLSYVLGVMLALFTIAEVNYARLAPQSQLAIFAMLGLVICFLRIPASAGRSRHRAERILDLALALIAVTCCVYIFVQTEPAFSGWWIGGQALGNRAGSETTADTAIGVLGLVVVLEATRRSIGLALPLLSIVFVAYAWWGAALPWWLFPHRGYPAERIVAQTFLHTQGVFGVALNVMFTYVFLFVIFSAFLQSTGATRFIIGFAQGWFRRSPGGPAKIAVVSSGLMGSLSGSAVANVATIGTFTIPLMRSVGFTPRVAAGIEAAASSGGALVPPVMGAGAYMMLEIIDPPVTYLQVIRAALLPSILYYFSIYLIVHFYARRLALGAGSGDKEAAPRVWAFEGVVFATGLVSLLLLLLAGYTPFRAVSLTLPAIVLVGLLNARTRLTIRGVLDALASGARDVVPLVCAAACVGIVIGAVMLTGIGTRLPAAMLPLAEQNLVLALALIMLSSLILGMGLPSAVSYLLLATLVGPVLGGLGVVPLAAHLFIFYFAMMSMVTPPVALAAYAAGSIAGANVMQTGVTAFRFALVGFTLPYIFVYRPQLLMLRPTGETATLLEILPAFLVAALGIAAFAGGIAGYLFARVAPWGRVVLFAAAALLLAPGPLVGVAGFGIPVVDVSGVLVFAVAAAINWRASRLAGKEPPGAQTEMAFRRG